MEYSPENLPGVALLTPYGRTTGTGCCRACLCLQRCRRVKNRLYRLAGYCFTATAERDGRRLISVVIKTDSYRTRFSETRKLLDYGFNRFAVVELAPTGFDENGQMTLAVRSGKKETVTVTPAEPLRVLLKPEEKENTKRFSSPLGNCRKTAV